MSCCQLQLLAGFGDRSQVPDVYKLALRQRILRIDLCGQCLWCSYLWILWVACD